MSTTTETSGQNISTLARYERLLEISRQLNSTLKIDLLLEHIVNSAAEMIDAEAASILLLDRVTGVLRFEAAIDPAGFALSSIEVPLENSIAGWVVTNGDTVRIEDVANDPRFYKQVDEASEFHTRNLMAVPMRARNNIIGCLEALNKRNGAAFTAEDVATLSTLAAQAAVAIENARLFEQSDLIAEMVHELRTPLAAIKATTYILGRPEIGDNRRGELLNTIAQETDRLTRMTTEFLDLARLESGRSRIHKNLIDLAPILTSCIQTVQHQANERQISLELRFHPLNLPEVLGDGEKIRQVVLNLLTNAIKYNRQGGSVTVQAVWVEDRIDISVEDTGLGMAAEDLPHMFEKFYRVADTEGYTSGTGLGLAIAKQIVEGHGGRIDVESERGIGTRFTFFIPLPK
jgi:signal transduction histidine kinase